MKRHVDSLLQRRQNMNWDNAANNLEVFKAQVQERWNRLDDEQLQGIAGRRERLALELQRTYGLDREQAEAEISDFENGAAAESVAGSGRGPTERMREFGSGNEPGGDTPHDDHHRLH